MGRSFPIRNEMIALVSLLALFAVFSAMIGETWFRNVPSLLRDISWLGIVAVGQAVVIVSGEFDLSVGSVYAFVSMIFVLLLNASIGPLPALALSMLLGGLIGYLNGVLTWRMQLPSLLVTLGFLFVYRGLVEYVTDGFPVTISESIQANATLVALGGKTAGFHNSIAIAAVILATVCVVMARTRFGSHIYAVGGAVDAATANGVPAGRIKTRAFMICAVLAGLAGVITACNLNSVSTTTATAMEFEAIAATVIGGCLLLGGSGTAWGAMLGVATLLTLKHGLILQGVNIFAYQIVLGVILVGLVAARIFVPGVSTSR